MLHQIGKEAIMAETVVILGASPKPERYSNMAMKMLESYGHKTILVSPSVKEIEGHPVLQNLSDVKTEVQTLTMYVGPEISSKLGEQIIALKPGRVIFNPGTENAILENTLNSAGIQTLNACTLVLLRTNQY
jgi:uncharacterized protein